MFDSLRDRFNSTKSKFVEWKVQQTAFRQNRHIRTIPRDHLEQHLKQTFERSFFTVLHQYGWENLGKKVQVFLEYETKIELRALKIADSSEHLVVFVTLGSAERRNLYRAVCKFRFDRVTKEVRNMDKSHGVQMIKNYKYLFEHLKVHNTYYEDKIALNPCALLRNTATGEEFWFEEQILDFRKFTLGREERFSHYTKVIHTDSHTLQSLQDKMFKDSGEKKTIIDLQGGLKSFKYTLTDIEYTDTIGHLWTEIKSQGIIIDHFRIRYREREAARRHALLYPQETKEVKEAREKKSDEAYAVFMSVFSVLVLLTLIFVGISWQTLYATLGAALLRVLRGSCLWFRLNCVLLFAIVVETLGWWVAIGLLFLIVGSCVLAYGLFIVFIENIATAAGKGAAEGLIEALFGKQKKKKN